MIPRDRTAPHKCQVPVLLPGLATRASRAESQDSGLLIEVLLCLRLPACRKLRKPNQPPPLLD
jgi:hypothetical protein